RLGGNQVHHRAPPLRILGGGDDADRFVQEVGDEVGLDRDRHAVDRHLLGFGVYPLPDLCHPAVDGDPTGRDQVLGRPAGHQAAVSDGLLQLGSFHRSQTPSSTVVLKVSSRASTTSAGGTWSAKGGSSSSESSPIFSRNRPVVRYPAGLPGIERRPASSIKPSRNSVRIEESESTPRISDSWPRLTG